MPDFSEYLVRGKRGHLIGIAGVSMSPLAEVLSDAGLIISGSDIAESERTSHLREKGIVISIGHDAANITSDIDFVVRTAAAHDENPEIVRAHEEGIIHFHDTDYFAQKEHNCDLINLEDMLQNGTVISETMIEKPHSFFTACNVTTQIVAQVASNQYGGQSISLTHLAPFVQVSREKIRRQLQEEMQEVKADITEEQLSNMVEKRLREGTASSAETTHFLKLATMKADLEKKKLEEENKLLRAKTETLESAKDSKEMYEHVLKAMAKYNGVGEDDEYDFG